MPKATFLTGDALDVAFQLGLKLLPGDIVILGPDPEHDNLFEMPYHGKALEVRDVRGAESWPDWASFVCCAVHAPGCRRGMDDRPEIGVTRKNIIAWRRPKRRKS